MVDGIASASKKADVPVTYSWDMRNKDGNLIEEGHYLVYVQLHAERLPQTMEQDTIVNGKVKVGIETCWDAPAYDNIGQHRVTALLNFKDSIFTRVFYKEKKWSGDNIDYLGGPLTMNYTVGTPPVKIRNETLKNDPSFSLNLKITPNPLTAGSKFRVTFLGEEKNGGKPIQSRWFDVRGNLVWEQTLTDNRSAQFKNTLPTGLYTVRLKSGNKGITQKVLILH